MNLLLGPVLGGGDVDRHDFSVGTGMISLLIVDEVWVLATLFASRIGDEGSAEPSPVNDFELTPITIGFLSKLLFRDKGGEGRMLYFEDLETDE